ncbi:RRM domain-containing protein [Entamoeba marina]
MQDDIFVSSVEESDDVYIKYLFEQYGLLYRCQRLESNESTLHVWFYSQNSCQRAIEECDNAIVVNGRRYEIRNSTDKTNKKGRQIKLSQMYEVCNYYLGFCNWSTDVVSLTEQFSDEVKENGITKYICQFLSIIKLSSKNHSFEVSGRGFGKYKGKDKQNVFKLSKKLAMASATKNLFSKFAIGIFVNIKDNKCMLNAQPIAYGAVGKENADDGIHELNQEEVDEDEIEEGEDEDVDELMKLF